MPMIAATSSSMHVLLRCLFFHGDQLCPPPPILAMQVLSSIVDYGLDPQAALDAPRFCIDKVDSCIGPSSVAVSHVLLEEGFTQQAAQQLRAKGHNVRWPVGGDARSIFGRGQVILRDKHSGVLCAGSDPRADGCAMGW
jgi:gamma-glutamyltranspeptidase/glutathione hydrolase